MEKVPNPYRRNSDTESCYENVPSKWHELEKLSLPGSSEITAYYTAEDLASDASYLTASLDILASQNRLNTIADNFSLSEKESVTFDTVSSVYSAEPSFVPDSSAYFDDGIRRVDFVLVHNKNSATEDARNTFETNLQYEGLELEYATCEEIGLEFVKIHAPWEVLSRYGEIMQFKMPIKELVDFDISKYYRPKISQQSRAISRSLLNILEPLPSCLKEKRLTFTFSRNKEYLFAVPKRKEDLFNPAQRSQIIQFILRRKRFTRDPSDSFGFGITKLLADGTYIAAYPLHEGTFEDISESNPRRYLLKNWASLRCTLKQQPLDQIRSYFGVKIGLYFAWLGFYTYMLISASVVGIICFIYGCATLYGNIPSKEICGSMANVTMCPLCENECRFWNLGESCKTASITYLFDNAATAFYAVFISIWGTVFLELWKRYAARITYRWDLTGLDSSEEHPRPEYLARLANAKKRLNAVTQMYEPHAPFWTRKVPYTLLSMSLVLLLISVAVAAVLGVILYRLSLRAALIFGFGRTITHIAVIITSVTAAIINLICIMIFNRIYARVATYLTEIEMHRTFTAFDNSLTLKMFLLQFVNYYSSIFYIAFFKGKFVGHPGDYHLFFGYRQEECGTGGCLMELAIQLTIIMVGKQTLTAILEMSIPWGKRMYHLWKVRHHSFRITTHSSSKQWEEDYALAEWKIGDLFYEYLEMVLQFGFITIFVAAFPLAPLFALANNAFEIRLDAHKLITSYRRPVGQRVPDIGIWYPILNSISKFAVLTNAIIIAFTSNTIPRLVFRWTESSDFSLHGFINYTLSYFNVSDFAESADIEPLMGGMTSQATPTEICRYQDFRHPPWSPSKYERTEEFLFLLVMRFGFVIIFVVIVSVLKSFVHWIIPDVPKRIKQRIRHETFITNEMIIEQELRRAKRIRSAKHSKE